MWIIFAQYIDQLELEEECGTTNLAMLKQTLHAKWDAKWSGIGEKFAKAICSNEAPRVREERKCHVSGLPININSMLYIVFSTTHHPKPLLTQIWQRVRWSLLPTVQPLVWFQILVAEPLFQNFCCCWKLEVVLSWSWNSEIWKLLIQKKTREHHLSNIQWVGNEVFSQSWCTCVARLSGLIKHSLYLLSEWT